MSRLYPSSPSHPGLPSRPGRRSRRASRTSPNATARSRRWKALSPAAGGGGRCARRPVAGARCRGGPARRETRLVHGSGRGRWRRQGGHGIIVAVRCEIRQGATGRARRGRTARRRCGSGAWPWPSSGLPGRLRLLRLPRPAPQPGQPPGPDLRRGRAPGAGHRPRRRRDARPGAGQRAPGSHYYTDKAPGLSFWLVPLYAGVRQVLPPSLLGPEDRFLARYLLTFLGLGVPAALFGAFLFSWMRGLEASRRAPPGRRRRLRPGDAGLPLRRLGLRARPGRDAPLRGLRRPLPRAGSARASGRAAGGAAPWPGRCWDWRWPWSTPPPWRPCPSCSTACGALGAAGSGGRRPCASWPGRPPPLLLLALYQQAVFGRPWATGYAFLDPGVALRRRAGEGLPRGGPAPAGRGPGPPGRPAPGAAGARPVARAGPPRGGAPLAPLAGGDR